MHARKATAYLPLITQPFAHLSDWLKPVNKP